VREPWQLGRIRKVGPMAVLAQVGLAAR